METDMIAAAFKAWLAAHDAWTQAERRLAEIKSGTPPPHFEEEVEALKAEADALFVAATEELRASEARQDPGLPE